MEQHKIYRLELVPTERGEGMLRAFENAKVADMKLSDDVEVALVASEEYFWVPEGATYYEWYKAFCTQYRECVDADPPSFKGFLKALKEWVGVKIVKRHFLSEDALEEVSNAEEEDKDLSKVC